MTTTHLPQTPGRYGLPEAAIGAFQPTSPAIAISATRPGRIPSSRWGRFSIAGLFRQAEPGSFRFDLPSIITALPERLSVMVLNS
jgi:hypothetical protein